MPRQLYLPLSFPGGRAGRTMQGLPLTPREREARERDREARWRELDARRPHATNLTGEERAEFERLDNARYHRNLRKAQA